jgi:hypothetical protein
MSEWEPPHKWPCWSNAGERVELLMPDSSIVRGLLNVADEIVTDEDEVPIFSVLTDDGREVSFTNHKKWRYCE